MTLNCACLFFYQLFDALDGKQARRTKSSSPLGELFDHGCDAMTTVFMTLTVNMSLRLGMGWWFYTNVLVLMILFYHSQWEVYYTGKLDLWYFNVTEGQFVAMFFYILPVLLGNADLWIQPAPVTILGSRLTFGQMVVLPTMIAAIVYLFINIYHVIELSFEKTNKKPSLYDILLTSLPCWFVAVLSTVWAQHSFHLIQEHGHYFCIGVGFAYCNLVGRLVTCRVVAVRYELFYWVLFPLPFLVANSHLHLVPEVESVYFFAFASVAFYLHYCLSLINEMTTFLNIRCLSIPYPPPLDAPAWNEHSFFPLPKRPEQRK
eukprot:TRINITY_DN2311_c0_g1_i2.p1 TRINITY_DN2311_c0_g1~~TRINITY_DN2311_c0_g1_i2.p1  ORF type:complete len:318 (+),score=39.91 TRINITY_DN2311_c0_g1_i2:223-1176(+)